MRSAAANGGRTRRARWIVGCLTAMSVVLAACSSGGGTPKASSNAGTPDPNGVLRFGVDLNNGFSNDFDPGTGTNDCSFQELSQIYSSVTYEPPGTQGNNEILPGIAQSWQIQGATLTLHIRPGVEFSDGTPVTAQAVMQSIEHVRKSPLRTSLLAIASMNPTDATTLVIQLNQPPTPGDLLLAFSFIDGMVMEPSSIATAATKPIGSGPFRVASYQPDNELVLEANPGYWGAAPGVKTLRFKDIPEVAARVTALITGEIDLTYALPPDQLATLGARKDVRLVSAPSFTYYFIWMNCKREIFTDARVRQAMTYALDVDSIVKTLMKGVGRRMTAPIASTIFGYAPQRPYAYDPAKAKQLLAAAGRANGFDCTMIWNPDSGPQDRELAQALFSYWGAIGVRTHDGQSERAQWIDRNIHLDWDMDFQTIGDTTGDADYVLGRLYTTRAARNGYSNPRLDQVLDAAAQSVDQTKRKLLYAEACAIIWDNAVGAYPIELVQTYAYRQAVEGFVTNPSFPTFTSVTVRR
ncbi:MAG TPA: ABC transporter substrate-binding protein [Acidimicrobiales bacterium]|nr:ABC transporter substrate-binding protein [Acidimicrobiales bacterium]